MQFMNSGLGKLVKNLYDEDFKYLAEEFGSEKFNEEKLPARKHFFSSTKKERLIMMVKYQMVT